MKFDTTITTKVNLDVEYVSINVRVHPDEIPNDFPFLFGNTWCPVININTGQICNFVAQNKETALYIKASDNGEYGLHSKNMKCLRRFRGYVPNKLLPGEFGDYIELNVNETGLITNWLKEPCIDELFQ